MANQKIIWTVLPYGRVEEGEFAGKRRVSIVVSPRLTPESADEQVLKAFPEFLDWPSMLAGAKFGLDLGSETVQLNPLNAGNSELWKKLLGDATPVNGFEFKNMSEVNLHSFAVRNVLGYLRRHYGRLAVQATSRHPTLLPWEDAHPDLKGMLEGIGTRTQKVQFDDREIEVPLPGFSRFFDGEGRESFEKYLEEAVFGPNGVYRMPVPAINAEQTQTPGRAGQFVRRTLPADWYDPRPGGPGTPLASTPDATLMDQFTSADEYSFYRANRFYNREPATGDQQRMRRPSYKDVPPPPELPEYDFHRIIASYADFPDLLRALGLLIDCVLEGDRQIEDAIAAGGGLGAGQMSLRVDWRNGRDDSGDTKPRTAWQANEGRFITRPRGDDQERGLLRLERSDDSWGENPKDKEGLFDIYQVDPDGAALKTIGFTLSAQNLVTKSLSFSQKDGEVTYTTGDRQPVAALRSGGLGVSRHDRAAIVAQDAAAAALKNQAVETANGDNVVFFAEDVLRGYRVDVSPVPDEFSPGEWYSLCARDGRYRLLETDEPLDLPEDEGYVSGASTTSGASDGVNPDDHFLHESMFRWTGWSLCAPRPGLTIRARNVEDTQLQGEEPTDEREIAEDGNGILADFRAPKGSLPKLRFGQLYRFRGRIVDVAGNSLSKDDPKLGPLENASDAVGYWRFEPIDPPSMVQRHRLSEGESLERMVIRSNYDADSTAYLSTPDFVMAIDGQSDFEYVAAGERHLVPPKSSQQQCEQHGLFDPYFGDPSAIKKGYGIAAREEGTLFDDAPTAQVELVTPANLTNVATTTSVPPELPNPENPVGDRLSGGQYIIHREAQVETPYLPDPAAAGVAIRAEPGHSLPGVTGEMTLGDSCSVYRAPNQELVLMVANRTDWPHSEGFRVVMEERPAILNQLPCKETFADSGEPKWDEGERVLTFFIAKGRIARLSYSSFAHPSLIDTFGIPYWTGNQAEQKYVSEMALMGCNWMLTPFRGLTLVHATQQPVCLPEMIKLGISRQPGAQHADLRCRLVRLHGPSTGKMEVEAEWYEWVDNLSSERPLRIKHKGQLGEIQLSENHSNDFPLAGAVNAQDVDPQRPRARADRHELGDTRFRLIEYRVRASTRFREYLPPSIYAEQDLVTRLGPIAAGPEMLAGAEDDIGAPVLRDGAGSDQQSVVPASAPPDDPRVLYVVPTFEWNRTDVSGGERVTRTGNGLRVWLDRPWFSSGDGEMLGVVIHRDGGRFTSVPGPMEPLVTQWGLDPLWDTAMPKKETRVTDFPARVTDERVKLQERPDEPAVHVVGHRVHWDDDRRLWYCDIELNAGASYMPFVRLALVRYQPNALLDSKVSKVVLAEFAQVLPLRRAVFKRTARSLSIDLRGTAPYYGPMKYSVDSPYKNVSLDSGKKESGRNRVELVLQTRDPNIDSDLAWKDAKILGSAVVGGTKDGGIKVVPGFNPGGIFAGPAKKAAKSRSTELRAGNAVRLSAMVERRRRRVTIGAVKPSVLLHYPEIWKTSVSIPNTNGQPARLMLREFERYYTDQFVNERRGTSILQRRVVEERLVYASIFDFEP